VRAWRFVAALVALAATVAPQPVQGADMPPLVLESTIPLDHVSGRIDHMAVDLGRRRLIVAELGNGSVDVIDLTGSKPLRRIGGLISPQGVAAVADRIIVASADDGTVRLFDAVDFAQVGVIALDGDADNIRVVPGSSRVVVGYGKGGIAVIEPATGAKISEFRLAGHPEGFQLHPADGRIFVNVPDARKISVIDGARGAEVASWKPPDLRANFPMAIDQDGARLASVFRQPARLVLFDTATGAVAANVETCGDADDVFFDAARRRIYVSCGEGFVDVYQQDGAMPRRIARVPTSSGARTSLYVPELDRLFVAARSGLLGSSAAILVFHPQP
jgi:DNA-binding beta-propeller fold protein YncE